MKDQTEVQNALLTVKQVAKILNVSISTLHRLRHRDDRFPLAVDLPIGNKTLFRANEVQEYLSLLGNI